MKRWIWSLFVVGCGQKEYPPCQSWRADDSLGFQTTVNGTAVHIIPPTNPNPETGTPTAVFIHGGWTTQHLPVEDGDPMLRDDMGFATLYLDLPPDLRGTESRNAVADTTNYAAGLFRDEDDCLIGERLPAGSSPHVVLTGFSNGGNLAWATAGDPTIEIAEISGVASFETPLSAGMALGESGTSERPNPRFEPSRCGFDSSLHFSCPFDVDDLKFASESDCGLEGGCLFLDANGNGDAEAPEKRMGSVRDPITNRYIHSPWLTAAAEELGVLPDNRADFSTSMQFWAEREATQSMESAALRFPDIGGISTGTEIDHVMDELPDGIHVNAMVQAMNDAGISYTRLHPGAKWMQQIHGDKALWKDNLPNEPVELTDDMEPEDDKKVRGTDYLSAAVAELLDRSRSLDVSEGTR